MHEQVGTVCPKVRKQGKDDVRVKVVYKVPSFCSTLHAGVGMDEALYTTFPFVSSLPCLYIFWYTIPTSFFFLFLSCEITPVIL